MPAVFVHGVPETTVVWDPLIAAIDRDDVETLGLPGFGSPLPDGFEPTMYRYADWLADAIAGIDGEIDLVAHDWGALLSLRVLPQRPANVRSWALDLGNLDDTFEWHATAKVWQTPGQGEEFMDGVNGASVRDRAVLLQASGVPESGAVAMAKHFDETMGSAILVLYRSATEIGKEWGPAIDDITAPGLGLKPENDPFIAPERVAGLAARTGCRIAELPGCGHWWMLDDPAAAAKALQGFWATL